jgi:hypothetical protein
MRHNFFYAFSNPLQRRRAGEVEIENEIEIAGTCGRISCTDLLRPRRHVPLVVLFMMRL